MGPDAAAYLAENISIIWLLLTSPTRSNSLDDDDMSDMGTTSFQSIILYTRTFAFSR